MKKILTLLLSIMAVPSFAVIGGVPSVTGNLYCQYGSVNQPGSTSQVAAGTVTGTLVTIQNTTFLVDNKKMMSYDAPYFKCPTIDKKKSALVGITAKVGDELYPIYNNGVKDDPDFTKNLNTYAGSIIAINAVQGLQHMLDNRKDFSQYKKDYGRSTINLQINGRQYILHKGGKSSIYKTMPTTYAQANNELAQFLSNIRLDATNFISKSEARAISDFITRYDSQQGILAFSETLTGGGATSFSLNMTNGGAELDIVISKENINTITLGLSYVKDYPNFLNAAQTDVIEQSVQTLVTIPVTINVSGYNPDILTNTLNVSINADKPYEDFIMLNYPSGQSGDFVKQAIFSSNINSLGSAIALSQPKNQDNFSMK